VNAVFPRGGGQLKVVEYQSNASVGCKIEKSHLLRNFSYGDCSVILKHTSYPNKQVTIFPAFAGFKTLL